MIEITEYPTNEIPYKYTTIKKDIKTKSIYVKCYENNKPISSGQKKLIAKSNTYSIYFEIYEDIEKVIIPDFTAYKLTIEKDGIKEFEKEIYNPHNGTQKNFIVTTSEPLVIIESFDYLFYCRPETIEPIKLKPMPKIDKLIDSSSFENVSTKLQEINNLLKISSDNLKTIMDANSLMYEPTDNFSTLIQKTNNKPKYPAILVAGELFNSKIKGMSGFKNVTEIHFVKESPNPNGINVAMEGEAKAHIEGNILKIASDSKIFTSSDCYNMFYYCINLTNINLTNFYTKNATNMQSMFEACFELTSLDLNNFDISNVTTMHEMFEQCNNLNSSITIINPNISKYDMMFRFCSTKQSSKFIINYINEETKKIAEKMIATKSPESNIVLGTLVTQ